MPPTQKAEPRPSPGQRPLVSILTPSLNQAQFIDQAMRSVVDQSYPSIEHIVIDGGSTDGTAGKLRAYERPQFRWISEPDSGMYEALNKGLEMSRGQVLGYLNADDIYPPWAVETAVRAFHSHPGAGVVFGDGLAIDESRGRQRLTFIPPINRRWLALSGSLVQPAVFWRRRASERHGPFDAGLRFVGDLDYWLRLSADEAFVRVNEVLAVERIHDAALSRASADRMAVEERSIRRRHHRLSGPVLVAGTVAARARSAWWRRRLWATFLSSSRQGAGSERGWAHFLSESEIEISAHRVALAQVPRVGAPYAWNAVVSRRQWFVPAGSPSAGGAGSA